MKTFVFKVSTFVGVYILGHAVLIAFATQADAATMAVATVISAAVTAALPVSA